MSMKKNELFTYSEDVIDGHSLQEKSVWNEALEWLNSGCSYASKWNGDLNHQNVAGQTRNLM